MKDKIQIGLVSKFDDKVLGEYKLVSKNMKYQFDRPVQEFIDSGMIEEIYFIIDTLLLNENSSIDKDNVISEYYVDEDNMDKYNLPETLYFSIDEYDLRIDIEEGLLKEKLKEQGLKEYEAIIYVETTIAKKVMVIAKNEEEVSNIIYGPSGDNIYEIIDDNEGFNQVHYEHGIQDIMEVK